MRGEWKNKIYFLLKDIYNCVHLHYKYYCSICSGTELMLHCGRYPFRTEVESIHVLHITTYIMLFVFLCFFNIHNFSQTGNVCQKLNISIVNSHNNMQDDTQFSLQLQCSCCYELLFDLEAEGIKILSTHTLSVITVVFFFFVIVAVNWINK